MMPGSSVQPLFLLLFVSGDDWNVKFGRVQGEPSHGIKAKVSRGPVRGNRGVEGTGSWVYRSAVVAGGAGDFWHAFT